jgi:hypothetical protein
MRTEIYQNVDHRDWLLHDDSAKRLYRLDHGHVEFASRLLHALYIRRLTSGCSCGRNMRFGKIDSRQVKVKEK